MKNRVEKPGLLTDQQIGRLLKEQAPNALFALMNQSGELSVFGFQQAINTIARVVELEVMRRLEE